MEVHIQGVCRGVGLCRPLQHQDLTPPGPGTKKFVKPWYRGLPYLRLRYTLRNNNNFPCHWGTIKGTWLYLVVGIVCLERIMLPNWTLRITVIPIKL